MAKVKKYGTLCSGASHENPDSKKISVLKSDGYKTPKAVYRAARFWIRVPARFPGALFNNQIYSVEYQEITKAVFSASRQNKLAH